jgi:hypothetical protein
MKLIQARDEIFSLIRNYFNSQGSTVPILWQGIPIDKPPDTSDLSYAAGYARATVLHSGGRQSTLGGKSGTRFDRSGVVIIQCFGPIGIGKGLTNAEQIATMALDALEGKTTPGGIWFRNCRPNDIGPADGWFQINVVAEFLYDEVK